MSNKWLAITLLMSGAAAVPNAVAADAVSTASEWPTYGHDAGGMRFSPLTQITPANAAQLKPAWVYHMKPEGAAVEQGFGGGPPGSARAPARFAEGETTPLVIGGVMYITTPYHRVVALDAVSGKEIWVYTLADNNQPALRGVEYWPGNTHAPAEIIFGSRQGKLFALNAKTGVPVVSFGDHGVLNTNTAEILNGIATANDGLSSPPIVYQDLVITGGQTQEAPTLGAAGDVRAWNVETGKLVWTFHSVPRAGEKFNDTWGGDSWKQRSGTNVWGFLPVDAKRGIVYMPFGAPSSDKYGGDRPGNNLFDSTLVAADARTGKYLWHFQVVHHDIWDFDLEAPPALIDVKKDGKTIPAVAVINKTGLLFLLDRVTGKPIYPVEERPVPASEVPLEKASPTQPFPLKPAPLARNSMTMDDIATVTPELEAYCRKLVTDNHIELGGPYTPVSYNHLRVQFPGNLGGANWGGTSFNPLLGYLFVNLNNLGQMQGFKDKTANAPPSRFSDPNVPYVDIPGGGRFKDPATNMMCQQPPWGTLAAVNVNTGEVAWQVPLGITDSLPADKQKTGRPNLGGTIATSGGLVFVGATDDARFRAFNAKTGEEVWSAKMGASALAVPDTYQGRDGKQYVAITTTGGGFSEAPLTDDSVTAFALNPTQTAVINASPAQAAANAPAAPARPLAPASQAALNALPPGPGHDLTAKACSQCHEVTVFSGQHHSRDQWAALVDAMVGRGMVASDDEIIQIESYLGTALSAR